MSLVEQVTRYEVTGLNLGHFGLLAAAFLRRITAA